MPNDSYDIIIVIDQGFPLLSLAFVTEPLRIANRESPRPMFSWRVLSATGGRPRSSSGIGLDIDGPLDRTPADAVILLASYQPDRMVSAELSDWLRRRAREGSLMGCVDTGALVFAEAGLLSRRPAAAHHEAVVGFREAYGESLFVDRLFDLEGDRCSSAGGVATFDMTLAIIEHLATRWLAKRVAEILNYRPIETARAMGAYGRDWSIPRLDRTLAKAIEIMSVNLEKPVPIAEICARIGAPRWQLRRLFLKHLGMTARNYYLELRLERARNLLRNSGEAVGTIAQMCGFAALESMSRAYKARYGIPPSRDRSLASAPQPPSG